MEIMSSWKGQRKILSMNAFRSLNSQASHVQKIPQFNLTNHFSPHNENRPLNTNYYNQMITFFKIDARFIVGGI